MYYEIYLDCTFRAKKKHTYLFKRRKTLLGYNLASFNVKNIINVIGLGKIFQFYSS